MTSSVDPRQNHCVLTLLQKIQCKDIMLCYKILSDIIQTTNVCSVLMPTPILPHLDCALLINSLTMSLKDAK